MKEKKNTKRKYLAMIFMVLAAALVLVIAAYIYTNYSEKVIVRMEVTYFLLACLVILPVALVLLLFAMLVCGNYGYYSDRYKDNAEHYEKLDSALEEYIPDGTSVACTTFLLPHIADRNEIYEVKYHKEKGKYKTDVDYVAFDMRYASENVEIIEYYTKNGYSECYSADKVLLILKKK